MLAIKLQRIGKKHQPSYRFVVAERRSKMAAPPVEDLGSYNPFTKAAAVNKERILYWMNVGAQPTVSVHNLLVAQGIVSAPKKAVKMPKAAPAAPAAEASAEAAATADEKAVPADAAADATEAGPEA
ncbi:MAG TPA: 30S ribosomal protein S16 [Candidatus Paceibacterota bacterium]|nr:30S ribosomal protein S16 [Candidatus Paceibacterota bacterium]